MGSIPITRSNYDSVLFCAGSGSAVVAVLPLVVIPVGLPLRVARGCTEKFAQIAQLVEHTLGKGEVGSSNLLLGSI